MLAWKVVESNQNDEGTRASWESLKGAGEWAEGVPEVLLHIPEGVL